MALILKDRVQETSTTTGTGTLTLAGAVTEFQSFSSAIGNGNTTYYAIYVAGGTEWEVGIGTVSSGALSRDTVYASSNAGALVNFSAGTKFVFGDYPAIKALYLDQKNTLNLPAATTANASLHIDTGVQPTTPTQGDIWNESTGLYYHNSAYTNQLNLGANQAGVLEMPTITITGSGATINASSIKAVLFSLPGWIGDYKEYVIPAATGLSLTDNSANYLIVSYNAGSPVYSITTNPATITNSDVVGATLLWRAGTEVHYQAINWGLSTASRINRRLVQTNRYERASGLALGESTGRVITLTAGNVWYGVNEIIEGAVDSSSNNADFYYHVSGVWTKSTVSTYNNTQYDNGTNLVSLSGAGTQYAVNWVYRYLDGSGLPKLAYVLGSGNYNQAQAIASSVPTPPPILSTMAILVGRIIVAETASTAFQIDSAFTQVFSSTTVTAHNDLSGLQGGTADEYYHLSNSQHTVATQAASSTLNGYLTSTDWTTFNSKGSGSVTSVNLTASTGISVSGGPVTSSGSITVTNTAPMTYPGAGIGNSTGSAWGTSYTTTGTGTVLALATTPAITNPTVTNYVETLYAPSAGSSFTVDLANGTVQKLSLNANGTITLPSSVAGKSYVIIVTYSGAYTLTWAGGSTIKWPSGTAPTASSASGKFDIFTFFCDGTNTYGNSFGLNY